MESSLRASGGLERALAPSGPSRSPGDAGWEGTAPGGPPTQAWKPGRGSCSRRLGPEGRQPQAYMPELESTPRGWASPERLKEKGSLLGFILPFKIITFAVVERTGWSGVSRKCRDELGDSCESLNRK